jgi:hypothetical protein
LFNEFFTSCPFFPLPLKGTWFRWTVFPELTVFHWLWPTRDYVFVTEGRFSQPLQCSFYLSRRFTETSLQKRERAGSFMRWDRFLAPLWSDVPPGRPYKGNDQHPPSADIGTSSDMCARGARNIQQFLLRCMP